MSTISQLTVSTRGLFQTLDKEFHKQWFVIASKDRPIEKAAKQVANFGKTAAIAVAFLISGIISPLFFLVEIAYRSIALGILKKRRILQPSSSSGMERPSGISKAVRREALISL